MTYTLGVVSNGEMQRLTKVSLVSILIMGTVHQKALEIGGGGVRERNGKGVGLTKATQNLEDIQKGRELYISFLVLYAVPVCVMCMYLFNEHQVSLRLWWGLKQLIYKNNIKKAMETHTYFNSLPSKLIIALHSDALQTAINDTIVIQHHWKVVLSYSS